MLCDTLCTSGLRFRDSCLLINQPGKGDSSKVFTHSDSSEGSTGLAAEYDAKDCLCCTVNELSERYERALRAKSGAPLVARSALFFSRPRSEGWPHHGRTFSIYVCPLSF